MSVPVPHLLLVEDNDDDVFVMRRTCKLAKTPYPLQVVTNGQEALDYLAGEGQFQDRTQFPLPFLIFLDLKLPYVDGFEVLAWIRSRPELETMPVVVLTSSPEQRDQDRAFALGAKSYLIKPPTPAAVQEVLASVSPIS